LAVGKPQSEWRVLMGGVPDGALAGEWRYTTDAPAADWTSVGFNEASWKSGPGGFGDKPGSEWAIRTPWKSSDIWLRRTFEYDGAGFARAMLVIHHDDETEVHLNGQPLWKHDRWNDTYKGFDITGELKKAVKQGSNTIAIHCHQDKGGQFVDAAILVAD
jgi:beta-galactosidase